jgi:hypothetical protein
MLKVEFMQHGTTIKSEVYYKSLKNCHTAIQKKNAVIRCNVPPWQWSSAYSCSHSSTAGTFHWVLFDHPPYSPDLAPNDYEVYHQFTYLKIWLGTQRLNNNEVAYRWQTSLTQAYKKLFLDTTSTLIPAVTTLRFNLIMYIHLYTIIFFLISCFLNSSMEVTFRIAVVYTEGSKKCTHSLIVNIFGTKWRVVTILAR